jgi:hypothetical protein
VSAVVVCAGSALALTSSPIDGLAEGSFATAALERPSNGEWTPGRIVPNTQPAWGQDRMTGARVAPATIAAKPLPEFVFDRRARGIHVEPNLCASLAPDRHSLRAPPVSDDDSSDADDDDGDDDGDGDGDGLWTPGRIGPKARAASGQDRVIDARVAPATMAANAPPALVSDRSAHHRHARPALHILRLVDRHSFRAPPVSDEDSSDADREDDDDDDDDPDDGPRTTRTGSGGPANTTQVIATESDDERPTHTLPTLDAYLPVSFVFDVQSLRAPPQ